MTSTPGVIVDECRTILKGFAELPAHLYETPSVPPAAGSPFSDLDIALSLRTIDYLDFWDLTNLRATTRYFRTLPTRKHIHRALILFSEEVEKCAQLLFTLDSRTTLRILQGVTTTHDTNGRHLDDGSSPNRFRVLGEWMNATKAVGIPRSHALMFAKQKLYLSRCDKCLLLRSADSFDLSQFGLEGHMYEVVKSRNELEHKDWHRWGIPSKDPSSRVCLECRFERLDEAREIGWLREVRDQNRFHIVCSKCLRREIFSKSTHDSNDDCVGHDTCMNSDHVRECFCRVEETGRMLNGKHCTRCFVHENLEWFAQKRQLEVEIAQKQWELDNMVKADDPDEEVLTQGGHYW